MAEPLVRARVLSQVIGTLKPAPGVRGRDLHEAMSDLEAALAGGQSVESLFTSVHRDAVSQAQSARAGGWSGLVAEALARQAARGLDSVQAAASAVPSAQRTMTLATVRTTPLTAPLSPLQAEWVRGLAPSKSYGPFLNNVGEAYWIDIFKPVTLVSVVWVPGPLQKPRLLALVPIRTGTLPASGGARLSAGSAWLASNLLVPGRPANEFVGVRIRGGSLAITGSAQLEAQAIVVSGSWQAQLQLTLDAPTAPPPASGVGADAGSATINLPGRMTLTFSSGSPTAIGLLDSDLSAYGTSASLKRSQASAFYDETTRSIVVPCDASVDRFTFAQQQSTLFGCGATAPVSGAGWAAVTTVTTPDKLGQASGAGYLWLSLDKGLSAKWSGMPSPVSLGKAVLQLAPGTIAITATVSEQPLKQTLSLWDEAAAPPRRSSLAFEAPAGSIIFYVSQPTTEAVIAFGTAVGHLDRPLVADGGRLAVMLPSCVLSLLQTAADTQAYVLGADPAAGQRPVLALALENLLMTVRPPALLWLNGPLTDSSLDSGKLTLRLPTQMLLPTLPDPYAANFDVSSFGGTRDTTLGWVSASINWTVPASAALDFDIDTGTTPVAPDANRSLPSLDPEARQLFLLDLSTNADQFGVAVPVRSLAQIAIDGLSLVAPAASIGIFTLPPISWEPMLTKQPNPNVDALLPPPPHDGGPAQLAADSVTLVPVAPMPLLSEYIDAVNQNRKFAARLPLPFGLIANIDTSPVHAPPDAPSDFLESGGAFALNQPTFDGALVGARQLLLQAPDSKIQGMDRHFPPPSYTLTEDTDGYAAGVLSQNIHTRWQGDFGYGRKGVPVERYELTGYGASMFSDWRDQSAIGPAITQARFDVLVGRTGYEVIQMQSTKYPWCTKVVRIITIQRTNGGWVLREDSGWLPASDGVFHFPTSDDAPGVSYSPTIPPAFAANQKHLGAIKGVVNIRNIRLTGPQFPVPGGGLIFQPVKFDADVLIAPALTVTSGGFAKTATGTRVPSRDIDGYIQITGVTYAGTINGQPDPFALPADRQAIRQLLAATGPAVAPLACTVEIGGLAGKASMTLRASQAAASCDDSSGDPNLVAALRGTPVLPRDGAWSLGRMKATDTAPNALDPKFAAPLVRPVAGGGSDKWHLADPADIRRLGDADKPNLIYGLLQSTGTQKTFFARPQAIDGVSQIKVPQPPSFADVAALFNAAGIFPNLGDAFAFDTLSALDVSGGEIGFDKSFTVKKVGGNPRETLLMNLGIVEIVLRYADEHVPAQETVVNAKVDPGRSPRWAITLKRVCFAVKYKSNDLIRLYADVQADERTAATFRNLNVHYVGFLQVLQSIFSNVQQVARFLPGGAGAGLQVGFSQGRLTVRNDFALPNLPLGTGQITDVAVAMGLALQLSPLGVEFVAGLGSSQKPFRWVVSPLAGTGVIQVGVNNKGLNILVQGGLGLGLAIDLGIAAGSAAITIAVEINTAVDPFELKAILSGRASVDVLRGLASATITLAAGLGIIPPENLLDLPVPPDFPKQLGPYTIGFVASVAVGIHISICWVVDVDWDDYWQFRQDITTPALSLPF